MPLTCTDAAGKVKAVGDTWSPVDEKCITCMCKEGEKDIYAECFSTRQVIVGECPEEFIERSEDGCVEICTKDDNSIAGCGLELDYESYIELEIDGENCVSKGIHRMTMCTGGCASNSVVKGNKPERSCNCCSATETESTEIQFECGSGWWARTKTHVIEIPTACSCNTSKCEAPEEDKEWWEFDSGDVWNSVEDTFDDVSEVIEDVVEEDSWWNFWGDDEEEDDDDGGWFSWW